MINNNRFFRFPPPQNSILPRSFLPPGPQILLPPPNINITPQSDEPSYDVKPKISYILGGLKEGLIRALLIFFYTLTLICVLAIPRSDLLIANYPDLTSTRIAFLIFAVAGLMASIIMFLMSFFNFANFPIFRRGSWLLILFIFIDGIMLILIFSLSITSAVRESQLPNYGPGIYSAVNRGAFAAAATFGFIVVILLIFSIIIDLFRLTAERNASMNSKKVNNQNQQTNNTPNNQQRF